MLVKLILWFLLLFMSIVKLFLIQHLIWGRNDWDFNYCSEWATGKTAVNVLRLSGPFYRYMTGIVHFYSSEKMTKMSSLSRQNNNVQSYFSVAIYHFVTKRCDPLTTYWRTIEPTFLDSAFVAQETSCWCQQNKTHY